MVSSFVSPFVSPSTVACLWLILASEGSGITSAVVRPMLLQLIIWRSPLVIKNTSARMPVMVVRSMD